MEQNRSKWTATKSVQRFLDGPGPRVLVMLLAVGLFVCGAVLSFRDLTSSAGVTYGASVFCLIFLFLTHFKRFEGFGIKAETWEQEMEQAAELRKALQELTERVGESVYWNVGEGARVQDHGKILEILERTDRNLRAAGIDPKKIEELKRPWHKCVMRDLADPIPKGVIAKFREIMDKRLQPEITNEKRRRMEERPGTQDPTPREAELIANYHAMSREFQQLEHDKLIWRDDFENVPRVLREFIDQSPWLQPEDRQAIYRDCREEFLDIDQYARDRTIRRPEVL